MILYGVLTLGVNIKYGIVLSLWAVKWPIPVKGLRFCLIHTPLSLATAITKLWLICSQPKTKKHYSLKRLAYMRRMAGCLFFSETAS